MCFLALSFMLFSKKTLPLHPESQLFERDCACRRDHAAGIDISESAPFWQSI